MSLLGAKMLLSFERGAAAKLLVLIKVEKLIFEAGVETRFSLSHGDSPSSPLGNGSGATLK
jgi:hypothetical protein